MISLALATLVTAALYVSQPGGAPCATLEECRTMALEAAGKQAYEAYHDLAWRALQKGGRNDRASMDMLARAQSLSGRPLDAVVMLERLAAVGVITDAATSDDFRRVRALTAWPVIEARLTASAAGQTPPVSVAMPLPATATRTVIRPGAQVPPPAPATAPRGGIVRPSARAEPRLVAPAAPVATPAAPVARDDAPLAADAADALRFTTLAFTPAGLAYDAVSDRFIVGDRDARKLAVVDEASRRVANLASAQSAGFGAIGALEIDAREGDLWVVTGEPATLHRLQLISGRLLATLAPDAGAGPARFADVAVTPQGSVLVLDALGGRLFVAPAKARRLDLAIPLDGEALASVAPVSDSVAYVAHAGGLSRVDLAGRRARAVTAPPAIGLSGFTRLRWHRGGLVGVQSAADGSYRIQRLKVDSSGQRVTAAETLDRALRMSDPTAAALSGDVLYYLAEPAAPGDAGVERETIIRRVTIK